jgi:protein-disulfide isomerase
MARFFANRERPASRRLLTRLLGTSLLLAFSLETGGVVAAETAPAPQQPLGLLPSEVDLSGLPIEKQDTLFGILSRDPCTCGCVMVMARCLAVMPCHECLHLSNTLANRLRAGDSRDQARLAMLATVPPPQPHPPAPPTAAEFAARPILESAVVPLSLEGDPIRGPATAPITLVEFSDFECSYCAEAARWAHQVLEAYPKDVRLVFKQAPLPFHQSAFLAAEASLAAHEQGKFWSMHDALFANNEALGRQDLIRRAGEIGLDVTAFVEALDGNRHKARVEQLVREGDRAGIEGTPTFFLNGRRYNGARTLVAIQPVIEELLGHTKATPSAPAGPAAHVHETRPATGVTNGVSGLPNTTSGDHGSPARPATSSPK